MIISVVLCEGVHDIAFISKILCANGCGAYTEKLNDYPYPIGDQLKNNYARDAIGEKVIGPGPASPYIPGAAYRYKNKIILFHNLGGDSDTDTRYALIEQYQKNKLALRFRNPDNITGFEFYLFYDADDLGVEGRIHWMKSRFEEKYGIPAGVIGQGKRFHTPDFAMGAYVFYDPADTEKKGTLEDQLLTLMRKDNSGLLDRAEEFLKENALEPERTKEYDVGQDNYAGGKKYKPKKSRISIAGQLQFSGMNNSVIILKSDYIKKDTILQDNECRRIAGMILG